ncbi:hypothetical protein N2601_31130 (plasmid) [Rhizobium sp. CB3060]|uniref:hypothetical protein n=1 Tax=Rhizobium sp. CB3060 TaxID=3138255 RepID=UPI0021A7FE77|nr:hypothetical protein [Rhizobium tropici]UWU25444.1 hypothetical protein N2601_31130 [Rhizobium tropici]
MSGSGRSNRSRRPAEARSVSPGTNADGGAGAVGGGGGGGGQVDPCALEFDVNLSGVNVVLAATGVVGQVMVVRLTVINGFDVVVCETAPGSVLGSLAAFQGLAQLIGCLRSGRRYTARITAINGATISVHVDPVP